MTITCSAKKPHQIDLFRNLSLLIIRKDWHKSHSRTRHFKATVFLLSTIRVCPKNVSCLYYRCIRRRVQCLRFNCEFLFIRDFFCFCFRAIVKTKDYFIDVKFLFKKYLRVLTNLTMLFLMCFVFKGNTTQPPVLQHLHLYLVIFNEYICLASLKMGATLVDTTKHSWS